MGKETREIHDHANEQKSYESIYHFNNPENSPIKDEWLGEMTMLHDEIQHELNENNITETLANELLEERGLNVNGDITNPNSFKEWYEFSYGEIPF